MTKVAIITRTKDRPLLLGRALESVLAQTFTEWHHVVVNDGGDPAAVERLCDAQRERYGNRLTIVHHARSQGMEAASNAGMRASSSTWAVIHDDDDSWRPTFLEECVAFLESPSRPPSVRGVVTHSDRVFEVIEGDSVRQLSVEPFNHWLESITLFRLAANNPFPPISFVFSREAWGEVGLFREDLPVLGDWDFHLRFVSRYDVGVIARPLANYHHRPSATGSYGNTIFDGIALHRLHEARLRNELLRRDLSSGRVGLGVMVNVAAAIEEARLAAVLSGPNPGPLGRIRRRAEELSQLARRVVAALAKPGQ